jgi:hypothetical protein
VETFGKTTWLSTGARHYTHYCRDIGVDKPFLSVFEDTTWNAIYCSVVGLCKESPDLGAHAYIASTGGPPSTGPAFEANIKPHWMHDKERQHADNPHISSSNARVERHGERRERPPLVYLANHKHN